MVNFSKVTVHVKLFGGQIVTVKCFEDNSRVKELLATHGTGKVLVVDGGASMRCALMGDLIAESAAEKSLEWRDYLRLCARCRCNCST